MPSIIGASPASIALVPTPTNQQSASPGRPFKAGPGQPRRSHKWQPDSRPRQSEPFTLMRGDHTSCTRKATGLRERLAGMAGRILGKPRHTCPASGAYAALPAYPDTRDRKAALLASSRQVNAIGRHYGNADSPVKLSADMIHDLINLSNSMKMLRRHDQDPADFLYPAVRAMHEAARGTPQTGRRSAPPGPQPAPTPDLLPNLLRDLCGRAPDDPAGLRAQLTRKGGGLDIWLANNSPPSYEQAPEATRRGMADEMRLLLDGLAGAARQVVREQLLAEVPAWAHEAQPGLFREARILYTSAQRWRGDALAGDDEDPMLQASPANAVDRLIERARHQALGTAAAPAGNLTPLLGVLSEQLSQVAARIDASLRGAMVVDYTPASKVIALRQELMHEVLRETGILQEIERLQESGNTTAGPGAPASPPATRDAATARHAASTVFQSGDPGLLPIMAARMRRASANAQREIANFLSACQTTRGKAWLKAKDKPFPVHKLDALHTARKALDALHGSQAQDVWQQLVDRAVASVKDDELVDLNTGTLWKFINGDPDQANRLSGASDGNSLPGDLWSSVRTESARRNLGPALQKLCATLSGPSDTADGKALFRQIDALRGQIDVLKDDKVDAAALLAVAMPGVSNRELGTLIDTLAWPPRSATNTATGAGALQTATDAPKPTLRKRVMHYLSGDYRGLSGNTTLPDRDVKNAHAFLNHLFNAACTESEKRMDTLRDAMINDFRTGLFEHAIRMHAMVATPEARQVNGPAANTLEQLIRDAVKQGRLIHEHGRADAATRMGTRFLRTANGYDVAGAMTRPVCHATALLHKRLDNAMKDLNMACFRSEAALKAWRDSAVDHIVRETEVWDRIDELANYWPNVAVKGMDTRRWSEPVRPAPARPEPATPTPARPAPARPAPARAGSPVFPREQYSTVLESPAGKHAQAPRAASMAEAGYAMLLPVAQDNNYDMPPPVAGNNGYAMPPPIAEDDEYEVPTHPSVPPPMLSPMRPTHDDHRVSKAVSDDSGFDESDRSRISLDGHLYDVIRDPAVLALDRPFRQPRPASVASVGSVESAGSVGSLPSRDAPVHGGLVAALQAALERRQRSQRNYV